MSTPPALFWFASFSNITSIAVVTLCFIAMAIFIGFTSLNADSSGSSHTQFGVAEQNMVKVTNPFFLAVEKTSGSLQDGLTAVMSSLCSGEVFVLWGPRVNPLHDMILNPGVDVRKACRDMGSEMLQQLDVLGTNHLEYPEPGEHAVEVPCPSSVSCEALGDTPRQRYPVVVFTFIPEPHKPGTVDGSERQQPNLGAAGAAAQDNAGTQDTSTISGGPHNREDPNCIIGLISIIHLRDDKVRSSSHVIHQYIKTAGIPLYSLQPLFMANTETGAGHNHNSWGEGHQARRGQGYDPPLNQSTQPSSQRPHEEQAGSVDSASTQDNISSDSCAPSRTTAERCEGVNDSGSDVRKRNVKRSDSKVCEDADRRTSENTESVCDSSRLSSSTNGESPSSTSQPECVVCQTRRAACVILPCRHACVCLGCFKLVDRCPMCRGQLESFFLLSSVATSGCDEDVCDEVLEELNQQAMNASLGQMWERLNNRLNHFFGFR